jgi:hypothetical protein
MPVRYAPGNERDVHAEFLAFRAIHPDDAADGFALIHQIAAAGLASLDQGQCAALGLVRPLCHQAAGWGVFFEADGPRRGRCTVTMLLVADLAAMTFEAARTAALERLAPAQGKSRP